MAAQKAKSKPIRKPRADGERNRSKLIEVAKITFAELGGDISLDEIARRAGVGIGTLYRHFPTRAAILGAVYLREVEQLAGSATGLLDQLPPVEALRSWMNLFVEYMATKKIIVAALNSVSGATSELFASSGGKIKNAAALLADRAKAAGELRADIEPLDLLYAVVGFVNVNTVPQWEQRAQRLIDILIAGSRPA